MRSAMPGSVMMVACGRAEGASAVQLAFWAPRAGSWAPDPDRPHPRTGLEFRRMTL